MDNTEEFISNRDTLSRLVRLETKVCLKFEEMEKAVCLAREHAEAARAEAKDIIEHRLETLNEHQRRMDRLEATFATKDMLNATNRIVYIGVGIIVALQFVFRFFIK